MKVLHNRQVHPFGIQPRILVLNSVRDLAAFMFSGTKSQVLGPLYDIVSVPLYTEWGFENWKGLLFRKWYGMSLNGKMDFTNNGERL